MLPVAFLVAGMLIPSKLIIPVKNATRHDWNHQTFWNDRWGRSGVHKGIDIFAEVNQPIISASSGVVVFKGKRKLGGNTIAILGPKWRVHYYAHLKEIKTGFLSYVSPRDIIGTVGRTGNAKNKPPHLHYSILSLIPYPWRVDDSMQGWKKAFFLDPTRQLLPSHRIKMARKPSTANTKDKKLAKNGY